MLASTFCLVHVMFFHSCLEAELLALLALYSPLCRTCTPGGVEPEPAGS